MDAETAKALEDLKLAIYRVKLEALATRVAFVAAAQAHPNPLELYLRFDAAAEQSIAATLPQSYPDDLVYHFRNELEDLRKFLRSIAQPTTPHKS